MESLAPPSTARVAFPAPDAPCSAPELIPGKFVSVGSGRLEGLRGELVAFQDGGKCVVRLFANVQLVISRDRLQTDLG